MALVVDGEDQLARLDPALIRLVARAQALRDRLVVDDGVSADDFAAREGVTPSWVTRLVRLAYLAPTSAFAERRKAASSAAWRSVIAKPHPRPAVSQHPLGGRSQACVRWLLSLRR